MARKTLGEQVDELLISVARISQAVEHLERATAQVGESEVRTALFQRESELLRQRMDRLEETLRNQTDSLIPAAEMSRRLAEMEEDRRDRRRGRWSVVGPVLGAIVNVLLAALVAYLVSR